MSNREWTTEEIERFFADYDAAAEQDLSDVLTQETDKELQALLRDEFLIDSPYQSHDAMRRQYEAAMFRETGIRPYSWQGGWGGPGYLHFNWITDRIAIGGDDYLMSIPIRRAMRRGGLTHILDCRAESWQHEDEPAGFTYLRNGTGDDGRAKTTEYFRASIEFGLRALADPEAKLYAHCAAGINRGPSGGYAIMRAMGMEAADVWRLIRTKRPCTAIAYAADAELALLELGYSNRLPW